VKTVFDLYLVDFLSSSMARRLKSDGKMSKKGKTAREYFRKNPDVHEKVKLRM